jgi:hypothetical protein
MLFKHLGKRIIFLTGAASAVNVAVFVLTERTVRSAAIAFPVLRLRIGFDSWFPSFGRAFRYAAAGTNKSSVCVAGMFARDPFVTCMSGVLLVPVEAVLELKRSRMTRVRGLSDTHSSIEVRFAPFWSGQEERVIWCFSHFGFLGDNGVRVALLCFHDLDTSEEVCFTSFR